MVLFGRKAQSDRRELLASMDQMAVGKPVDNGELTYLFSLSLRTRLLCVTHFIQILLKMSLVFQQINDGRREMCAVHKEYIIRFV
jgi:hypothetical protein